MERYAGGVDGQAEGEGVPVGDLAADIGPEHYLLDPEEIAAAQQAAAAAASQRFAGIRGLLTPRASSPGGRSHLGWDCRWSARRWVRVTSVLAADLEVYL